ncbi:MAG TPA: MerR family transcriptional regulator [Acidimicrobiales bacterium]|nr:MerR family transcriptional regulator [Acidimicrobiales bacterium]
MNARSYLSIGQVLDLLKQEFPDLTISKIRFLESQGLLDPERTPSGYRKFYDPDVERLRFILRAQQDQYLPLKVIKGRLGEDEAVDAPEGGAAEAGARDVGNGAANGAGAAAAGAPAAAPAAAAAPPAPTVVRDVRERRDDVDLGASRHPSVVGGPSGTPLRAVTDDDHESLTLEELATVSGLSTSDLSELERFGLLMGRRIAGTTYYDADCATIAAIAARFRAFGVEARHLRMYRTAVEREAGFFEQVVTPMLKQRNPQARRQAVDALMEMSRLGSAMREAVLRLALREHTGGAQ